MFFSVLQYRPLFPPIKMQNWNRSWVWLKQYLILLSFVFHNKPSWIIHGGASVYVSLFVWQINSRKQSKNIWILRGGSIVESHLKLCMKCLNLSVRLDSGTMMLMGMLAVFTLSFFTLISGPKGRKRTRRRNSVLDSPLKVSSYRVPLSFSVRVTPDGRETQTHDKITLNNINISASDTISRYFVYKPI